MHTVLILFLQGNGFNSSTIPVYQAECSPARVRGMLLTTQAVVTIFGLCIGKTTP